MPKTFRMPETAGAPKRIVLRYLSGPFAGLDRIIGIDDEGEKLPDVLENLQLLSLSAPAGLLKVNSRYALYQEVAGAPVSFHPEQQ